MAAFVPWSPNATDLGLGRTPNHVGRLNGEDSAHGYTMALSDLTWQT